MKKVLVILADGFEEMEALSPIDLLRRAGASVTVAGLGKTEITSSRKVKVLCDKLLSETDIDNWDAVVLPGGMPGATNLAASEDVKKRILSTYSAGKFVCAICASPAVVLAPLGIIDGKKAVCYPGMEKGLDKIKFCADKVLRTDNIITARGAGCALEFGLEIVSALFTREKADDLAIAIVY